MIALESQDQNISVYVKDLNMHETASKWVSSQFLVGYTESTKAVARFLASQRGQELYAQQMLRNLTHTILARFHRA